MGLFLNFFYKINDIIIVGRGVIEVILVCWGGGLRCIYVDF